MLLEIRSVTERKKLKFRKGQSGNPGWRPKVLGDVQELPKGQRQGAGAAATLRMSDRA
jgi:hypothetical protein